MLQKVRDFWIKGVLEQSLYAVARLELKLTTNPEAIEDAWKILVQRPDQISQPLPQGTRISTAFDELGKALLILGAPGCGKTTLLLELAKDLLDRAEKDEKQPIPIVVNLSSWAVRQLPLAKWIVDELCERYQVPRKYAQIWIDKDLIIPLLDGLDEVAPDYRSSCVKAINDFRIEHGLVPMAICSRTADYEKLATKLHLQGALIVQPLTLEQTTHYLIQAGEPLAGVSAALQNDQTLWEILDTPLMLSVAALAYHGRSAKDIMITGSSEERKLQLFTTYTEAMFNRRGKTLQYSRQKTIHWLAWLASAMASHNQSVFYIEWIQQSWLFSKLQQRLVNLGAVFLSALSGSLVGVLLGALVGIWDNFVRYTGYLGINTYYSIDNLSSKWSECPNCVLNVLISEGLNGGWIGLWIGSLIGIIVMVLRRNLNIKPVESVRWVWSSPLEKQNISIINGLKYSLLLGGLVSALGGAAIFFISNLLLFWNMGILERVDIVVYLELTLLILTLVALFVGFFGGLLNKFSGTFVQSDISTRLKPNEGIHRSILNAFFYLWLYGGIGGFIIYGLLGTWLNGMLLDPKVFSLTIGIFGLYGGLRNGGIAVFQHLTLRFLLCCNGFTPWRYISFLEQAVERVFLRKVGGGYIFVHRMLLEYFAALHPKHTRQRQTTSLGRTDGRQNNLDC